MVTAAHAFFALLPKFGDEHAGTVLDEALRNNRLTPDDLAARAVQIDGARYPGIARVRAVADAYCSEGAAVGRSVLERHLHAILDRPGMPAYRIEVVAAPWHTTIAERVDVMLRDAPVIIEADGRHWHEQRSDAANDERRDNLAAKHGFLVLRYGWFRVVNRADEVAAEILDTYLNALALRPRPRPRPRP